MSLMQERTTSRSDQGALGGESAIPLLGCLRHLLLETHKLLVTDSRRCVEIFPVPSTFCIFESGLPPIFGKSIANVEEFLNANPAWPPGTYRVLEKSNSLPPGVTDRLWGFIMKAPDASVVASPQPSR
jgi:hypothetical protein